ncbi:RimJ/RimL family protein N-acetyltransferase [Rhodoligotrophos appendicifer]|uniref:GNAT family N-acetyltransferase n=1 Tax=Rhodoligotrophos appendicifer TaxID=987056 RepID=UPI0011853E0E|nr:GNAT family protein [Rhodoligotrophos appendicifer]
MIKSSVVIRTTPLLSIETDHLIFHLPRTEDIPQMLEMSTDPSLAENALTQVDFTPASMAAMLANLPDPPTPQLTFFGLYLRKDPARLFGVSTLGRLPGDTRSRLSLWIRPCHRRQRPFGDIIPAMLEFAFRYLRLKEVEANSFAHQPMSPRVLHRYGFKDHGERMGYAPATGVTAPLLVMRMSRAAWFGTHRQHCVRLQPVPANRPLPAMQQQHAQRHRPSLV